MKIPKSLLAFVIMGLWLDILLIAAENTPYAYHLTLFSLVAFPALFKLSNERYGNEAIDVKLKYPTFRTTKYKTFFINPVFVCLNLLGHGTNAGRLTDHLDTEFYRNRIRRVC